MDVNDNAGKGGFFAVDARTGALRWFFDLASGSSCKPNAGDDVHHFDGYHTAAQLGLPGDFFATRPGCNFDRTPNECGNVWSSASIDVTATDTKSLPPRGARARLTLSHRFSSACSAARRRSARSSTSASCASRRCSNGSPRRIGNG
jgi:hypothetical protein